LQIFKTLYSKSVFLIFVALLINSCSTKKNTPITRTYHNLTSYYNVYFNGKEALKSGIKKIDEGYKDNYSLILPIFKFSDNEAVRVSYGDMNRVIEKGSKCIRKHSITEKPKRKEGKSRDEKYKEFYDQKEFVKWIDDSYLLIGKGHFYKHDHYPAIENFNYIVKEYSNKPIKYDGYLWLARTYTLMEKYDRAFEFLKKVEAEKDKVPDYLVGPFAATQVDVLIRTKQHDSAIPYLLIAIENTKDKKKKVRYQYILAQLYQTIDEIKKAYDAYGVVVDLKPNYEMTFNARINRASIFNATAQDSRQLQKELYKMLKDDKNIDFRDQIYYALGNIAFNESRDSEAIDFFILSANASTENTNQKSLSYLAAADIYFDRPDYRNSQMYYDSSMVFLSKEYPDYVQIKNKSSNLNELVQNLEIIEREDSIQKIAALSEAERNIKIDRIIADLMAQEQLEKELLAQQQRDIMLAEQQGRQMDKESAGQWYFYNPSMLSLGQSEFKKKFGDRKNEDDWRRKNKTVMDWDSFGEDGEVNADSSENIYSNKTREYYLVGLPLTDSAMQVSEQKIEEAYYDIATLYKEKFNDFTLSINAYLELLKSYPQTEFRLLTYYNLYKLYFLEKDYKKAEEYKNLVINEYPSSEYAKVLSDPDYFKQLEKIENQVKFIYQATYKYFINDNCDEVYYNYRFADSAYSESKLIPKFALLATLCSGHSGDTIAFKDSLSSFQLRYPNTEEATYAQEVLAALDRDIREVILEEEVFGGDLATLENMDSIDVSMYNFRPDSVHYYIVVVSNEKADVNRVKFNLTNFNLDYYYFLEFNLESELLSADYSMVTVTRFKNRNMANNYFESVKIAGEIFEGIDKDAYREFVISRENYKVFLQDKNLLRYQKFFDDNYLKSAK
jgi:tetratricopeptide (TPR) repeat protein